MKTLRVLSPLQGRCLPLGRVPDPVFAQSVVGPGVAVVPPLEPIDAVAPVGGRLIKMHPHAYVIRTPCDTQILVHLGVHTVGLSGLGFTPRVEQGADLTAGQVVISWDPKAVVAAGCSPVCPVVVLDVAAEFLGNIPTEGTQVTPGSSLFTVRSHQ